MNTVADMISNVRAIAKQNGLLLPSDRTMLREAANALEAATRKDNPVDQRMQPGPVAECLKMLTDWFDAKTTNKGVNEFIRARLPLTPEPPKPTTRKPERGDVGVKQYPDGSWDVLCNSRWYNPGLHVWCPSDGQSGAFANESVARAVAALVPLPDMEIPL